MSDNPPPAPDWILGPDGHWRPPPFEMGRAGGPPAMPPPGMAPTPPPLPPPTAPPTWGPGWAPPPPPPSPPATGRIAAVVGGLAVGAIALVVVAVAAVTFLGTPSEHRETTRLTPFEGDGGTGDAGDTGGASADEAGGDATGTPLSEQVARQIATDLEAEGWAVQEAEPVSLDEAAAPCMPAGWREGVTDRFRVAFHARAIGEAEVRTSAYSSAELAQADLARVSSDEFRACLEQSAEDGTGLDVAVEGLAPDPATPGVTYRSTTVDEHGPLVQDDTYIFVGRVRAYVSYCTCEALDEGHRQAIALEVAAALAAAQGLPSPG